MELVLWFGFFGVGYEEVLVGVFKAGGEVLFFVLRVAVKFAVRALWRF